VKTAWATLIAAVLLFSSGCVTRPDWIQATLVTADVTGVWQGTTSIALGGSYGGGDVLLDLQQEGPRVTGRFQAVGGPFATDRSSPLEGRVGGDVLTFSARHSDGVWIGELTVSGDRMEGDIRGATGRSVRVSLRRVNAPESPRRSNPAVSN
jgi:hypothetical protein